MVVYSVCSSDLPLLPCDVKSINGLQCTDMFNIIKENVKKKDEFWFTTRRLLHYRVVSLQLLKITNLLGFWYHFDGFTLSLNVLEINPTKMGRGKMKSRVWTLLFFMQFCGKKKSHLYGSVKRIWYFISRVQFPNFANLEGIHLYIYFFIFKLIFIDFFFFEFI